jgi:hypothetical protein
MSGFKSLFQKGQRYVGERAWFSGLFDSSQFKPDETPVSDTFQKIETVVRDTDKIDTYDLIVNLQMPSIVKSPILSYAKSDKLVDYYCNNKIHIRLYFKDERLFDNLTQTQCVLSSPLFKSEQSSNYTYSTTERTDIKSSGMYLSSFNDLNVTIEDVVNKALTDGALEISQGVPNTNRTGPFADSEKGVNKDNVNEKLKQSKYRSRLIDVVDNTLSTKNPKSPFKAYNVQYKKKITGETGGLLASTTNFSNIEEKRRFFDGNYQHYMQFDFNLKQYTVDYDDKGKVAKIVKKENPTGNGNSNSTADTSGMDTDESVLMLLKKNEWISIVFQDINIPFDIKSIPANMVRVEFVIDNSYPIGYTGPLNLFYRNFFCEYLNVSLKEYIDSPIAVHDVMFMREDMLRALKLKSGKYFSKIAQLNNLARRVLYYYLKNIDYTENDIYSSTYTTMDTDMKSAKQITDTIVNGTSANSSSGITNLKATVKKANNEIINFSNFFKRDKIKYFRKIFFEALLRGHAKTGLSAVSEEDLTNILKKIQEMNSPGVLKPGVSRPVPTTQNSPLLLSDGTDGKPVVATNLSASVSADALGTAAAGGGDVGYQADAQEGGVNKTMFQSEDYNLMIPMDIHEPGTGINDMVVRVHKIHLSHIDSITTQEIDDETSVDIRVGDAVRFVYGNVIVYAIICGFKPGKDLNSDGSDKAMNMTHFRETYIDISKSLESSDLSLTPDQFLSLTNLRGIKYLPFKYVDDTYSFVSYDGGSSVSESLNENIKRGLNGQFNFSCNDEVIPILPNGYIMPFTSRFKEGAKTLGNKLNPFSTKADIGKDNTLPQYSLRSYMTLDKVLVPPNFADVVSLLKESREDNPDAIFDKLKKIMENQGLNESNDCKKTSVQKAVSYLNDRKKTFMSDASRITKLFNSKYVQNGIVKNMKGAIQFIKNLYMQPVKPGVFVDKNGLPLRTATQLVYCLNLIPGDPLKSMNLLVRALSSDDVPDMIKRQQQKSAEIIDSDTKLNEVRQSDIISGGGIQYGGANDISKADKIIKDTIALVAAQKFFDDKTKTMLVDNLDSAEATYDPNEKEDTRPSPSSAMVKSGRFGNFGMGSGANSGFGSNLLASIFKSPNRQGVSSASGMGTGIGNDSCGNNTSIVCNGEDLIVTVTLKLNELISSCMNPEMIQHLGNHPGNNPGSFITNGEGVDESGSEHEEIDSNVAAAAAPAPLAPAQAQAQAPPASSITSSTVISSVPLASLSSSGSSGSSGSSSSSSSAAVPIAAAPVTSKSTPDSSDPSSISESVSSSDSVSESPPPDTRPRSATGDLLPGLPSIPSDVAEKSGEGAAAAEKSGEGAAAAATSTIDDTLASKEERKASKEEKTQRKIDELGGGKEKNNNKSKKNKKSNKNKTKKRKNSSSKKIKFTKVKTL